MTCPCKDCDHRKPACHGSCEVYKAWKDPLEALRLQKVKEIPVDNVLHDGHRRRNKRWEK